jgi:hypothetical protein
MREAGRMINSEPTLPLIDNIIRAEIVKTEEQLRHAYAIRAICFMEENGVLAAQAFDGNDLQATHIIVYAGDEPVGSQRIRWFKDFAKIERSAFRKAWRHPRHLRKVADFVFAHIARKGYDRVITHAQPVYARLWRSVLGFQIVEGKAPVYFHGHEEPYLELVKHLAPPANAITAETDASVLFRIEGEWDCLSTFESES